MDSKENTTLENVELSSGFSENEIKKEQQVSKDSIVDKNNDIEQTQEEAKTANGSNNFTISNMPEAYKNTYEEYIKEVSALSSVPITKSVTPDFINEFKFFNLRYYEDKFCTDFQITETGYNDTLIRIHSNKLFLISLASGNDIIRCGKEITGLNFMVNNNDRSKIKLAGKRKRGAKVVEPHTILCQVKCKDKNKLFNIRAGVPGRVIEINEFVKTNPDLLRTDPKGYGFLAVVAPVGHPSNYETVLSKVKLLNQEEYIKYLTERPPLFCDLSKVDTTEIS